MANDVKRFKKKLKLLVTADVKKALHNLEKNLNQHSRAYDSFLLLMGRYNSWRDNVAKGVYSVNEKDRELNLIRADIIALIGHLMDEDFVTALYYDPEADTFTPWAPDPKAQITSRPLKAIAPNEKWHIDTPQEGFTLHYHIVFHEAFAPPGIYIPNKNVWMLENLNRKAYYQKPPEQGVCNAQVRIGQNAEAFIEIPHVRTEDSIRIWIEIMGIWWKSEETKGNIRHLCFRPENDLPGRLQPPFE